ncbi:MAG: glycine--tRNA ligase subunit beta [Coriobacteriia bacterium]|nr:glycine--tRNA ligase subunit beta [Coriobacteriia bacterium]
MFKTFIFELGCEELPALDLIKAVSQYEKLVSDALKDARIDFESLEVLSTPRRITLKINNLAEKTEELKQRFRGPQVQAAFDDEGNPSKAALGFARSKGVRTEDLTREFEGDKEYVYANTLIPAQDVREILLAKLPELVLSISWPHSQRWGTKEVRFARPIRWLFAMLDDEVLPLEIAGLSASKLSYGNRLISPSAFEIKDAHEYEDLLKAHYVIPSFEERARIIKDGIAAIEQEHHLQAELPENIFNEVVNLCEWPTPMLAYFDEEFLDIPQEIITDAMLTHQRYFPLYKDGKLSHAFIVTSNGNPAYEKTIVSGNERVVRARLSDAAFFYKEDSSRPLESYLPALKKVAFHEKLGSIFEKVERMQEVLSKILKDLPLEASVKEDTLRAAKLSKADLVTSAVVEFTELQGTMGGYYAQTSGEHEAVAKAISEHYRPRFAKDQLPSTTEGKLLALADKLDTICGIFAAGQAPTGSSDPYALRRSAIGIINILKDFPHISLEGAIDASLSSYKGALDFDYQDVKGQIADFFTTRMGVMAKEDGIATDTIAAVSGAASQAVLDPLDFFVRAQAFEQVRLRDFEIFENLAQAYTRANNLRDEKLGTQTNPLLYEAAEKALDEALDAQIEKVDTLLKARKYQELFEGLASLKEPIDTFFNEVLVMSEDEEQRENHLKLLNKFVSVFAGIADISSLAR